jgi:hypothetical protein
MRSCLHLASLIGVAVSVISAAAALGSAFLGAAESVWPAIVLAWATAGLLASLIGLGGSRPPGGIGAATRPVWVAAGAVLLLVGGGLSVALLLGEAEPGGRLMGGLPAGAAVLVYVVGIFPAFVIPVVYAWGFDRTTLGPDDLERLRDRASGVGEGP